MKRLSFIMMALAMVMAFTQCKKDNQTPMENNAPVLEGEEVHITLTLNSGSSDSRADVIPDDADGIAPVKFKARNGNVPGDIIWVAYDGKNVGSLECTSLSSTTDQNLNSLGVFTGTITITQNGNKPLYFYFLGNKQPQFTTNNQGAIISYTVDLTNQSSELPVISYAMSEQNYPSDNNQYTVKYNWLKNQCALVKFKMENIYDKGTDMSTANGLDQNSYALYKTLKPITIAGMKNKVTINLAEPGASDPDGLWGPYGEWNHSLDISFEWGTMSNNDGILLYRPDDANDSVRYAIVCPMDYTSVTQGDLEVDFDDVNDDYGFFGTYKIGYNVANNAYYKDAKIDLVWHSGAFSVSGSQKVVFSRGNLQYGHLQNGTRLAQTWRFAKHQYDWVGGEVNVLGSTSDVWQGNVVLNEADASSPAFSPNANNGSYRSDNRLIGESYSGWIDLFGYGTGDEPLRNTYQNSDYRTWNLDWGAHNIVNSGKPNNVNWWVTLTDEECDYLFNSRVCSNGAAVDEMYGFGTIQVDNNLSVHGLIVLPDNWSFTTNWNGQTWKKANWTGATSSNGHWTTDDNAFTVEQWKDMELHGAIFLPACGYRDHRDIGTLHRTIFDGGYYQYQNRGTYYSHGMQGPDAAYGLGFGYASGDDLVGNHVNAHCGLAPDNGRGVRLVHKL